MAQLQEVQHDIRHDANKIQRLLETFIKTIAPLGENPMVVFDAVEMIQDALLLIQTTIIHQAKFHTSIPDQPVYLHGSPQQFLQLLHNLLVNATQALYKEAWSENHINLTFQETSEQQVELMISDTGIGIAPDVLPHIFDFFFTTKGEIGCGLGLAICKKVVEDMKGTIHVTSQINEGTTFRILFPKSHVS
jgi:signal transduction histidine kinase